MLYRPSVFSGIDIFHAIIILIILIPYDKVVGVDHPSIIRALEVPRVADHSTAAAAVGACVPVQRLAREHGEHFLHHMAEVGAAARRLQPLRTVVGEG